MSRDEIVAKWAGMKPRARDAWVQEVVTGRQVLHLAKNNEPYYPARSDGMNVQYSPVPSFAEDIAAAWSVVERLRKDGYTLFLSECSAKSDWLAAFERGKPSGVEQHVGEGKAVSEAICLAALIAKLAGEQPSA